MKKHLFLIFSCITMNACAMEVEKPIDLLRYPTEILDLIASFLTFDDYETEQEFIKRTKALSIKETPQKFYKKYSGNVSSAYCPNNKIFGMIAQPPLFLNRMVTTADVIIIDTKNNISLHKKELKNMYSIPKRIAVSADGNMIAFLTTEIDNSSWNSFTEVMRYTDMLKIKNILSNKEEEYRINLQLPNEHPTIAFNKQGTDIIIHGNDFFKCNPSSTHYEFFANPIRHHDIIPLTINTPNSDADHKKTLKKYFLQRKVCKDITKQIQ